jgi:uncharacterized membrane protein YraQ (UPF0718 family)
MSSADDMDMKNATIVGLACIIIAAAFTFVAIISYRKKLGGIISFREAFVSGLYVALISALFYASVWEVYYHTKGKNFVEVYTTMQVRQMEKNKRSAPEIEKRKQEMQKWGTDYRKFPVRFITTVGEVLPVGIVVSLIAAAILKRKKEEQ